MVCRGTITKSLTAGEQEGGRGHTLPLPGPGAGLGETLSSRKAHTLPLGPYFQGVLPTAERGRISGSEVAAFCKQEPLFPHGPSRLRKSWETMLLAGTVGVSTFSFS